MHRQTRAYAYNTVAQSYLHSVPCAGCATEIGDQCIWIVEICGAIRGKRESALLDPPASPSGSTSLRIRLNINNVAKHGANWCHSSRMDRYDRLGDGARILATPELAAEAKRT